ncbi:MAG: hypothetical protein M3463_14755, partial [Verrucomicrobiota bacterium]|nr:hypothetical protein [Verrucomicrobiota bacterium]
AMNHARRRAWSMVTGTVARGVFAIPLRDTDPSAGREALEAQEIDRESSRQKRAPFCGEVVEERRVIPGGQRKVEFGGSVPFIGLLAGFEMRELEKPRPIPEQLKSRPPILQILPNARLDERKAILPFVFIRRAIESGLCDAEQQAHQGNALVGFDGEVAQFVSLGKEVLEAEEFAATVGAQRGYPRINGKIHTPL